MLNFTPTFRALTSGSPITTALDEARRMARRHLETGGAVVPAQGRKRSAGFLVPAEVDGAALVAAIGAKLRAGDNTGSGRNNRLPNLLERRSDGQVLVPRTVL